MNPKIDEMYTETARLNSFKNWPFGEDAKCSASAMAEAGFFHCPTQTEPDAVQCYVCFKELDGWKAQDDPWEEHLSHSKGCRFAMLGKPQKSLTFDEIVNIEADRKINKVKKVTGHKVYLMNKAVERIQDLIIEISEGKK